MAEFKIGDRVKVKNDCSKIAYGEYGIVTNTFNILDKIKGSRVYQYQVTFRVGNTLSTHDYLYFFEGELEHSAWDTKLGELL